MAGSMPGLKGWMALVAFALQNGSSAVAMQWIMMKRGSPMSPRGMVLVQELVVKLPTSIVLFAIECGGARAMLRTLESTVRHSPWVWAQMSIPALLYTLGTMLQTVGAAHVDAPVALLVFQSKIPATAMCSRLMLGSRLSRMQWLALYMLTVGIVLVSGNPNEIIRMVAKLLNPAPEGAVNGTGPYQTSRGPRRSLNLGKVLPHQMPSIGIGSYLIAAVCSSVASVHLEKLLKQQRADELPQDDLSRGDIELTNAEGGKRNRAGDASAYAAQPSLWLRNIQLSFASSIVSIGAAFMYERQLSHVLVNMDALAFVLGPLQGGLAGFLVALVLRHADSVLRGFASAGATLIATLGASICFGFTPTRYFYIGASVVCISAAAYSWGAASVSATDVREKEEIEAETAPLRLAHSQPMEAEEVPEASPHLGTTRASPLGALVKADQAC